MFFRVTALILAGLLAHGMMGGGVRKDNVFVANIITAQAA